MKALICIIITWLSFVGSNALSLSWTPIDSPNSEVCVRENHAVLVFQNKLWVLGGIKEDSQSDDYIAFQDTWSSADGINWTLEKGDAPWGKRHSFSCIVFGGKIWIFGGWAEGSGLSKQGFQNDVWTSEDGKQWNLLKDNCTWNARGNHSAVVHNNQIWLMGGYNGLSGDGLLKDIWTSTDGINWNLVTASPEWSARQSFGCVSIDSILWVIAGSAYETPSADKSDVWCSENGINWNRTATNAGIVGECGAIIRNGGIIATGYNDNEYDDSSWNAPRTGVLSWISSNGSNWQPHADETNLLPLPGNHFPVIFKNKIWLIGGDDIWPTTYYFQLNDMTSAKRWALYK